MDCELFLANSEEKEEEKEKKEGLEEELRTKKRRN
jgi:hypothetical protein